MSAHVIEHRGNSDQALILGVNAVTGEAHFYWVIADISAISVCAGLTVEPFDTSGVTNCKRFQNRAKSIEAPLSFNCPITIPKCSLQGF